MMKTRHTMCDLEGHGTLNALIELGVLLGDNPATKQPSYSIARIL